MKHDSFSDFLDTISTIVASNADHEEETDVALAKPKLKKPAMYAVIFFNDDYTPMDFVIDVLEKYFGHATEMAIQITYNVHYQGKGLAGVYPKDIAETKAKMVVREARAHGHPLMCDIEPYSE